MPFRITLDDLREQARERAQDAARAEILRLVAEQPGHYSKTGLIRAVPGRDAEVSSAVDLLLRTGDLHPNQKQAKLYVREAGNNGQG